MLLSRPALQIPNLQPQNPRGGGRRRNPHLPINAAASSSSNNKKEDNYHSTLKALNSDGRRRNPRKSLGQHYMLNSCINEQLAAVAQVGDGDLVLEIGPGTGSLTNVLINAGATVIAVEKDPHMADLVKDRFGSTDRLMVLQEDFVKCDIRSHLSPLLENRKCLDYAKVVANIPFNISTDVVKLLLPMGDLFSEVVLLLQEETALRLVDAPLRSSEYRPINIFVNFYSEHLLKTLLHPMRKYSDMVAPKEIKNAILSLHPSGLENKNIKPRTDGNGFVSDLHAYGDPEYKFKVERTNFFPQPNVDAAVVKFKLKLSSNFPPVSSTKSFFSMVNSAFNGKRKMLRKSLQHLCSSHDIESALKDVDLPITARPEELTMDDFVMLHNSISKLST